MKKIELIFEEEVEIRKKIEKRNVNSGIIYFKTEVEFQKMIQKSRASYDNFNEKIVVKKEKGKMIYIVD